VKSLFSRKLHHANAALKNNSKEVIFIIDESLMGKKRRDSIKRKTLLTTRYASQNAQVRVQNVR
jgi:hypothetical protein